MKQQPSPNNNNNVINLESKWTELKVYRQSEKKIQNTCRTLIAFELIV